MPVKILMCPCYKDYFKQYEVPILRHLIHFHCKCKGKDHEMFIHFCGSHPYGTTIPSIVERNVVEKKCFAKENIIVESANTVFRFVII